MEIQVSVEHASGLERRIRVQVPASGVEIAIDKRLRELARTLSIKGFRPGKIPQNVVRQRYGTEIRRQVLQEFLQRTCRDALKQQNFEAVGPARIEQEQTQSGDELAFVATFEIYPEFEVQGIEYLTVERPAVEVTGADIDELIQRLRKQRRSWRRVERPARVGDRVTIDFEGTIEEQPITGARGDRVPLVIGEAQLRDDVASRLIGIPAPATFEMDLAYAEGFPDALLAGRTVRYQFLVREVEEECLPDVGREFCRSFGIESGEVAALREAAEQDMIREAAIHVREEVRLQLLNQLSEATTVELPVLLCDQEISKLQQQVMQKSGNKHVGDIPQKSHFRATAERNVRMGLIVRQIFKEQHLRILREEVNAKIVASCAPGEDVEKKQTWYFEHPEMLDQMEYAVMDDKVLDWLTQRAAVTEKPMTFVELVDMRRQKSSRLTDAKPHAFP